jgi:pyruvate dehydrogenase E2 component (dihydrolipoamide acetyltransferase)
MPRLGLTMTEGTIVKWLKQEGDFIAKGEEIVEVESDKSVSPVESTEEGYLLKILLPAGETVDCLTDIAIIGSIGEEPGTEGEGEAESGKTPESSAGSTLDTEKTSVSGTEGISVSGAGEAPGTEGGAESGKAPASGAESTLDTGNTSVPGDQAASKVFASPSAKRTAKELGIDLAQVPITPGKVRIEKEDVLAQIGETGAPSRDTTYVLGERKPARADRVVKLSSMRKVIALRMKESLDAAAHVALTIEVDMGGALDFKDQVGTEIFKRYGAELSINDIIVKCTAGVLRDFPRLNSIFSDEEIIEKSEINIGVAVALDEGLAVPVIRDCDHKSLGEIAAESRRLSEKARTQGLLPDEMSGGTFTVSNLGMFGITQFTSIINQPESAILSVGAIVKRPFASNGETISVRPMMNLTVNFDHRPIDGALSARFLKALKQVLESPALLLAR